MDGAERWTGLAACQARAWRPLESRARRELALVREDAGPGEPAQPERLGWADGRDGPGRPVPEGQVPTLEELAEMLDADAAEANNHGLVPAHALLGRLLLRVVGRHRATEAMAEVAAWGGLAGLADHEALFREADRACALVRPAAEAMQGRLYVVEVAGVLRPLVAVCESPHTGARHPAFRVLNAGPMKDARVGPGGDMMPGVVEYDPGLHGPVAECERPGP